MIKEALNAFITPKIWAHDRTKTIGASEIGTCARRVKYSKTEHDHDHDHKASWGATERGNIYEAHLWAPALRHRYGENLLWAGKEQKTFFDGPLSATPDGMLINQPASVLKHLGVKDIGPSGCIMIEAKTIDPRVNLVEAKHHNIMQTQVQMGTVRLNTKYKPQYSVLSYANASFMDDITEFVIEFDQKIYDKARARAQAIIDAKAPKDLKPEGWIAGAKECEHCPWLRACGIERHNLPSDKFKAKQVDPQFRAEIVDMVRKANKAQAARDAADTEFRGMQEEIRGRLREKEVRKIDGVVNWIGVKGRISYDNAAIRAAAIKKGIDVEKFSDVGDPTDRLILSDVGGDL